MEQAVSDQVELAVSELQALVKPYQQEQNRRQKSQTF